MKFLQEDTPITALLTRFMDLILVNVLFVLCCVPILTIGASFTAMYDVCMKLALRENVKILSDFFGSFARNLKRSTLLYFLTVAAGIFLIIDFRCAVLWETSFRSLFQIVILSVGYFDNDANEQDKILESGVYYYYYNVLPFENESMGKMGNQVE